MTGLQSSLERAARDPFDGRLRDAWAISIAIVALAIGTVAFAFGSVQTGVSFGRDEQGRLTIADIAPWSTAWDSGLQPGMVVIRLDDQPLLLLPGAAADEGVNTNGGQIPDEVSSVEAARPFDLEAVRRDPSVGLATYGYYAEPWRLDESGFAVVIGVLILSVGGWWLASGRAGDAMRRIAAPTVVATAVPLLLVPAFLTWSPAGFIAVATMVPLAMIPLADGLSMFIPDTGLRRTGRLVAFGAAVYAVLSGLGMLWTGPYEPPTFIYFAASCAITLVVGGLASTPRAGGRLASGGSASGVLVDSIEYLAAGATPPIAIFSLLYLSGSVLPILLWIAALLVAQRVTVQPLVRLATRATLQRDLVVAATEAERSRIATDLHDVALQDLTLLVRQLDAKGDTRSADAARRVVEQLRTITGELRLPILDDLGVGPALEWLVQRMERLAGGEVRLEHDDGARLPPDVELAFFRVAQEALSNAVKHGRPPIVVRYRVGASGATLTIDDAGPGILVGAAEAAPAAGHFGLLGMQQRAEQIGALLDVRRWPTGGTHVALEWRSA